MYFFVVVVFFFFSSRRRHTRSLCDWSSDVCSSDLLGAVGLDNPVPIVSFVPLMMFAILFGLSMDYEVFLMSRMQRSEERRVGKECRSRGSRESCKERKYTHKRGAWRDERSRLNISR